MKKYDVGADKVIRFQIPHKSHFLFDGFDESKPLHSSSYNSLSFSLSRTNKMKKKPYIGSFHTGHESFKVSPTSPILAYNMLAIFCIINKLIGHQTVNHELHTIISLSSLTLSHHCTQKLNAPQESGEKLF